MATDFRGIRGYEVQRISEEVILKADKSLILNFSIYTSYQYLCYVRSVCGSSYARINLFLEKLLLNCFQVQIVN